VGLRLPAREEAVRNCAEDSITHHSRTTAPYSWYSAPYSLYLSFLVDHLKQGLNVSEAVRESLAALGIALDLRDVIRH